MTELAKSLGGVERHALDWFKTSEEAKEKTDKVAVVDEHLPEEERKDTLYQLFQQRNYILKEHLRAVRADFNTVTKENEINKLKKYQLDVDQLRSTRIAFIEHCNEFDCFYIDLND